MVDLSETLSIGARHRQAGQLAEAQRVYRDALRLDPQNPDALHALGSMALEAGQVEQALQLIGEAARREPSQAVFHANLAEAYRLSGDLARAVACNQTALRLQPQLAFAHFNLGGLYFQTGDLPAAEQCYRQVVEALPGHAQGQLQLARVLYNRGKFADAEAGFRQAVHLAPSDAQAHLGLGLALQARQEQGGAKTSFEAALAIDPSDAKAHNNLANVLKGFRQYAAAETHYREAIRLDPSLTAAYGNLGAMLTALGRHREAVEALTSATERDPRFVLAFHNLVVSLREIERVDDAVAASLRAIQLSPDNATLHSNLGVCFKLLGRLDQAIDAYRTALRLDPQNAHTRSNLIYTLNYRADDAPASIFAEHLEWGRVHADALTSASRPHSNDRTSQRRLRVGYVSAHFHDHAVNFFVEPILAAHDHECCEVFCYSNSHRADGATERLKSYVDHWRQIELESDERVAELVRADGIDILVDLSGHIAGHRLTVFARKPAPVQVTYIGYQNTTGLQAMDYRLTDAWADPPGTTDEFYTEKLVRLPRSFFCYRPSPDAPSVSALPALANGYVTFASLNNFAKVTPEVLAAWARILQAVPRSRIVILASNVPSLVEYVNRLLTSRDVDPSRVTMAARRPRAEYLELLGQVDVALDPFPMNGHTTTCDALWQGVPVVTLAGGMYAGRFGSTAHVNLGLEDLVAESPDEYVGIATGLAGDVERLGKLRAGLRERMTSSPLLDFVGFTRNLEAAYRRMWTAWCASESF